MSWWIRNFVFTPKRNLKLSVWSMNDTKPTFSIKIFDPILAGVERPLNSDARFVDCMKTEFEVCLLCFNSIRRIFFFSEKSCWKNHWTSTTTRRLCCNVCTWFWKGMDGWLHIKRSSWLHWKFIKYWQTFIRFRLCSVDRRNVCTKKLNIFDWYFFQTNYNEVRCHVSTILHVFGSVEINNMGM